MRRAAILATIFTALAFAPASAAEPVTAVTQASELSAQARRPGARLRVYPGRRLLYRDCTFRLVQERRPSGTVIVPRQHCWWVRG